MPVGNFKVAIGASIVALSGLIATPAYAGPSDDECAIWLCLPTGFVVSECDKAFTAMVKRVTRIPPKSPLPLITSCLKGPDGDVTGGTTASVDHRTSNYDQCDAGFEEIGGALFADEFGFTPSDGGRGTSPRICRNYSTGESYTPQRGQKRHHVTVTIDGVEYDTFSFTTNQN